MEKQNLVSVENISRDYNGLAAVSDVSFHLNKGEVLGFLGANGAGKSTTMNMLCGVLAPSAGAIYVAGHNVVKNAIKAKQALGYLPEHPPLYRDLKVDEYLLYCAGLRRISKNRRQQSLVEAKQRCGLSEVGHKIISQLSKGYQQRVGIAQAIIHMPALIVLDEPTVGLDPVQLREIRALIRELAQDHGVILSTHILQEVEAVCDRVQILNHGRLVFSADTTTLSMRLAKKSLLLGLRQVPGLSELSAIAGVQSIEPLGEGRYRLAIDADNDPAERVAEYAVSKHLRLYELSHQTVDLEQLFVDMADCKEPE